MSQCKKLIRCMETAEEHGSQCVNHKPAHEPKTRCDAVLKNNRQCRNWARTHETKCSSHGPAVVRSILVPEAQTILGSPLDPEQLKEMQLDLEKSLWAHWTEYKDLCKQPIEPIAEWIEQDSWDGRPLLAITLPAEDAHDMDFGGKLSIHGHEDDDKLHMTIVQEPQKA